MLVDFSRKLYTVEKEIIQENSGTKELICPHCKEVVLESTARKVDLTIRSIVSAALQTPMQEDAKKSPKEREEMFDLLMKIHGDPVVDLSSEEQTKLKERVSKVAYNNLIAGQVLRVLEGKENPFEPDEIPIEDQDKEPPEEV